MIGHIETFQDVQALSHVMGTVGYQVVFKGGKGYVLEKDGEEVTTGYRKYLDFLAICKQFYDRDSTHEV